MSVFLLLRCIISLCWKPSTFPPWPSLPFRLMYTDLSQHSYSLFCQVWGLGQILNLRHTGHLLSSTSSLFHINYMSLSIVFYDDDTLYCSNIFFFFIGLLFVKILLTLFENILSLKGLLSRFFSVYLPFILSSLFLVCLLGCSTCRLITLQVFRPLSFLLLSLLWQYFHIPF